jgi:phosphate transport system substrate-binding protein
VDFINDSVQVIVTARPFNNEEIGAIKDAKIEYREYNVALDGVAVILNRENPRQELRVSELDSILTGVMTAWGGDRLRNPIKVAVCGINSSTNEIVRTAIMHDKPFSPTATYFESSGEVLTFVRANRNAIGVVNISWLRDFEGQITVAAIGGTPTTGDSVARFYSPAQANIYRGFYPLSTKVFMYNREIQRTVGLGFIAYVSSVPGQKVFQENGLVPATMPVRLVETTSKQVTQ